MGLIKYKFNKFYEIDKELSLGGNPTCILIFEKIKFYFQLGKF